MEKIIFLILFYVNIKKKSINFLRIRTISFFCYKNQNYPKKAFKKSMFFHSHHSNLNVVNGRNKEIFTDP